MQPKKLFYLLFLFAFLFSFVDFARAQGFEPPPAPTIITPQEGEIVPTLTPFIS